MALAIKPLAVAGAAALLLVVVVAVDVTMNRSLTLELRQGGGWVTLAADPFRHDDYERMPHAPISLGANETAELRLRVENDYPWSYSKEFRVYANGILVHEGRLEADANGGGVAAFAIDPAEILGSARDPSGNRDSIKAINIHVEIGNKDLMAYVEVVAR